MKDITHLIFLNCFWLIIGFALYYILSTLKVFLLVRIQALTFYNPDAIPININSILKLYSITVFKFKLLHQNTLRYLFKPGPKVTWRLIGNKKIDLYYNFLSILTTLLKPYLIIAILWAILKVFVAYRIEYDELKITLAEIQLHLIELNKIELFTHFKDYKDWYFIGFMFLLLFLSIAKKWEAKITSIKNLISIGFTVLSILFSISFFAADIGLAVDNQKKELGELQLEVIDMHNAIFKNVAEAIIFEDLSHVVFEDLKNNEKELNRIDSLIYVYKKYFPKYAIPKNLTGRLYKLRDDYALQINISSPQTSQPPPNNIYTQFYKSTVSKKSTVYSKDSPAGYFADSKRWNKKDGLRYLGISENLRHAHDGISRETNKKLHEFADELLKAIISKGVDALGKSIGFEEIKVGNALLEFVAFEKIKSGLGPKLEIAISRLNKAGAYITTFKYSCFSKRKSNDELLQHAKDKHDFEMKTILEEELKAATEKKAEELVDTKIEVILNEIPLPEGYRDDPNFPEFKRMAHKLYKEKLKLSGLTQAERKNILNKLSIADNTMSEICTELFQLHPGPQEGCPLCHYMDVIKQIP